MASHFTAVCNEESVDFESVAMFDAHVTPGGSDALLRRTAVTPRNSDIPLPAFSDTRPR